MSEYMAAMADRQIEGALSENETLRREIDRLQQLLAQIGEVAHDASTGPAVPDVLWRIRGMAYGGLEA